MLLIIFSRRAIQQDFIVEGRMMGKNEFDGLTRVNMSNDLRGAKIN